MRIKNKVLQKIISVFSSVLLLANSFTPYLLIAPVLNPVKAQEETVTPTEEPTITPTQEEITPTPTTEITPTEVATPTPIVEVSPTVEVTPVETVTPTKVPTLEPTDAPSVPSPPDSIGQSSLSPTAQPSVSPTPLQTLKTDGTVETTLVESYSCRADSLNGCLMTDKPDYAPTEVVIITGHGFLASTIYTIKISSTDEPAVNFEKEITTDSNGSFTYSYQLDGNYRPNYKVELKDSSGQIVASVTFTDGVTVTTAGSGNWNSTTNNAPWPGGVIPLSTDNVIIATGNTVTVTAVASITNLTLNATSSKLVINSGQTLTVSGTFSNSGTTTRGVNGPGTILFTGTTGITTFTPTGTAPNVTIGDGASTNTVTIGANTLVTDLTISANATLTNTTFTAGISGNLSNSGTFTAGTGVYTLSGTSKTISGTNAITIQNLTISGTTTNNGILTVSTALAGASTLTNGTNATLNIGDSSITPTLTAIAAGNTVNYTGVGAQTIANVNYNNLGFSGARTTTNNITIGGAVGVAGTLTSTATFGTGNFVLTGSTIAFNGTGAQTIPSLNGVSYRTLALSGSGTKTLGTATAVATAFSIGSGVTFDPASFILSGAGTFTTSGTTIVPGATFTTNYTIAGAKTISAGSTFNYTNANPTIDDSITYQNLQFSGTSTAGTSGTLTIQGNLTNTGGGTLNFGTRDVTLSGTVVANNIAGFTTTGLVSKTKTAGTATFIGNVNGGGLTISGAGTLNLGMSLTHTFTGIVTLTAGTLNGGSSTLNENATSTTAWNGTGTVFSAGTGTVSFGGVAQTLSATTTTFNNLTFTGSGTKTLSNATVINGTFTNGSGVTIATGNRALTFGGDFTNSGVALNAGSSAITFNGTATQSIAGFTTTGLISMTKTGGTATFTGNVNGGALTINGTNGTLNLGTGLTHTFTGTWTRTAGTLNGGSSTLNFNLAGNVFNGTGGTFTANTGTVNYNNATAQAIPALTYNNLTLSGGGVKTVATTTVNGKLSLEGTATITVTGAGVVTYGTAATLQYNTATPRTSTTEEWITPFAATGGVIIANTGTITMNAAKVVNAPLTINSGAKLDLFTFLTNTATSLILGGVNKASGTWGSTSSSAAHKNDTYFAATTGILTVASGLTPTFSGLTSSQSIAYGTANVTLSGIVSATGPVYPANGETVNVTINGSTLPATIAGGVGGFSISFPTATIPVSGSPYTITYAYTGDDNLNSAANNTSTTLTVNKANQTINVTTPAPISATYNDSFDVVATATSGLPVAITTSGGCSGSGTGSATITMTSGITTCTVHYNQTGNGSYNAATEVINSAAAQTKNLTVSGITANNKSYDSFTTAMLNTGSAALVGIVNSDPVTLNTGGATGTFSDQNVADGKTVTVAGLILGGAQAGNYSLTQQTTTADITPATLTYTANPVSRNYGADNPAFSGTVTGFVGSETQVGATTGTLTFTSSATATSNVNSYAINGSGLTANNGNYTFVQAVGNATALTIDKASLEITASDRTKTYGQTVSFAGTEFITSGLQNSETVGSVNLTSTGAAADATVSGSPYHIVPSTATGGTFNAGNYTITYNNGSLTVNRADQTITFHTLANKNYGNPDFDVSATVNSPLAVTFTADGSCSISGGTVVHITGVGSCTITAHQAGDDNYNVGANVDQSFNITDNTPPVITLIGSNTVTLEIHHTYIDAGTTASDNYDGNLTSSVVINATNINKDVVGSYTVTYNVVDAHGNHATQVTRTVNVVDSIDTAFNTISSTLVSSGIANNLNDVVTDNIQSFSGLYFEKSIGEQKMGKITFTAALDLSSEATQTFLQNLGTYMEANQGSMKFNATTAAQMKNAGAEIKMYGINVLGYTDVPPIIVKDDLGNILSEGDANYPTLTDISYAAGDDGTLTFDTSHFTQFDLPGQDQTTPDGDGNASLSGDTTEVVITDPNQAVTVTVASGTTNPTIDVSAFITDGTGVLPQITIESDNASVVIPDNTTVTGPSDWNGVIAAPTVTTITLPETSGETKTLSTAIEIGFADAKLSFDKAVRILLPGQAGKRTGYSRPGTAFTEITSTCSADSQAAGDALGVDGDCKIDASNGLDLVLWTKHFTKFATYTQSTNSTGNGGGGTVAGATAPVCNDTKPASAPSGLTAVAGLNSVTLSWAKASDPVSYYLVTYGTSSGSQTYGNPNIGDSSTTSYTVTNLSGGVTYYFKVRAGNGCAPGDFSNEASATPSGGFVAGVAPGFAAGVLGAATSAAELTLTPKPSSQPSPTTKVINIGQVKGLMTKNFSKYIFPVILLILLILLILYFYKKRKTTSS